jgi:hypothetical protein
MLTKAVKSKKKKKFGNTEDTVPRIYADIYDQLHNLVASDPPPRGRNPIH